MVEREVVLPVAPMQAWAAVTESDWLRAWLADEVELELRPGGEARFVVEGAPRSGWVEEASAPAEDRPGTLAFWWQQDGEPASRVAIELTDVPGGTRLRVVESRPLELPDLVGSVVAAASRAGGSGPVLLAA